MSARRAANAAPVASVSKEKDDMCPDCNKAVLDKEKGVQCEICEFWFHIKCQKLTEDAYVCLQQNEAFHFYCLGCNRGVVKLLQTMRKVEERQDRFEATLDQLRVDMNALRADLQTVSDLNKSTDTKLETVIESKLVENIQCKVDDSVASHVKILKDDVAESMEIEKRRTNLIFHGVKESGVVSLDDFSKHPDQEMIEEILKTGLRLDASRHIEEIQRIGRFVAGKDRPVRVRVKTFEARSEILKRAHDLKENENFKRVFIAPDLTRKQQAIDKDLREKLKDIREKGEQNAKIKAGKVIKNGVGGQVIILYQPLNITS